MVPLYSYQTNSTGGIIKCDQFLTEKELKQVYFCIMPCQCKGKIYQYHDRSQLVTILLCNPKFVCKNNWYFDLISTYFLYPLASYQNGKTGNACFHQAELTLCFSDQVLVLLCLPRSIKGKCLLSYA